MGAQGTWITIAVFLPLFQLYSGYRYAQSDYIKYYPRVFLLETCVCNMAKYNINMATMSVRLKEKEVQAPNTVETIYADLC